MLTSIVDSKSTFQITVSHFLTHCHFSWYLVVCWFNWYSRVLLYNVMPIGVVNEGGYVKATFFKFWQALREICLRKFVLRQVVSYKSAASLDGDSSIDVSWTAQKMKFSIKDFFSKFDQICRKLRIWSHSLKKSLMENFIFVQCWTLSWCVIHALLILQEI